MEYILQKIKSTHEKLMNNISTEFEDRIDYEQDICYDQHRNSMDEFASCACEVKKAAENRVQLYKKKIAYVSFVTSRCLLAEGNNAMKCRDDALNNSQDIMNVELEFIKNWNPHVPHVPTYQE
jgi:hypothetical protein